MRSAEGMLGKRVRSNRSATYQVFLDDGFQDCRRAGVIPNAFGIHDGHRAADTDLKTVRLRSRHGRRWPHEPELLQPAFEKLPGLGAARRRTALRLGGFSAEQNVPPQCVQSQRSTNGRGIHRRIRGGTRDSGTGNGGSRDRLCIHAPPNSREGRVQRQMRSCRGLMEEN